MNYNDYILSKEWAEIRFARIRLDKYRCQVCGFGHELQVHHINYDRLGHEDMEDLITLCVRCHNDIHIENRKVVITHKQAVQFKEVTEEEYIEHKPKGV